MIRRLDDMPRVIVTIEYTDAEKRGVGTHNNFTVIHQLNEDALLPVYLRMFKTILHMLTFDYVKEVEATTDENKDNNISSEDVF